MSNDDFMLLSDVLRNEAANAKGGLRARLRRLADRAKALEDAYYDALVYAASPPEGPHE